MITDKKIILFDGACNLCNYWVRFVLKRDTKDNFRFATLSSNFAKNFIQKSNTIVDSVVFIEGGNVYIKSTAALKIVRNLSGLWKITYLFILFPSFLRNYIYDIVAKKRYQWFGKSNCEFVPNQTNKNKFLM